MDRSRFVVLEHTQPASQIPLDRRQYLAGPDAARATALDVHYDLMLQSAGGLLTWALPHCPSADHLTMPAVQLPIHRSMYLQYEGAVSNNRGTVTRVMAGTYALIEIAPKNSLEGHFDKLSIELFPSDQEGTLRLVLAHVEQERFVLSCSH